MGAEAASRIGVGVVLNAYAPSTKEKLDRFCKALSAATKLDVISEPLWHYEHLMDALRDGRIDLAWLPPLVALQANDRTRLAPIALPVRRGRREYHAVLIARESSPILSVADIEGASVAWVDRRSASGYELIRAELVARGVDLERAFSADRFLGAHEAVARAVEEGEVEIGATFAHPGLKPGTWRGPWGDAAVRILADVGPIPPDLLAATSRVPVDAVRAILRALMASAGEVKEAARELFDADSFALPDPRHLEKIASLVEKLGATTDAAETRPAPPIADPPSEDCTADRPSGPPTDERRGGLVIAGKYRLEHPLKHGGMGTVWLATHMDLGTSVAVKLIRSGLGDGARARFTREAKAVATIRSTNVVQILDYGVDRGMPYMVMELLEGEDLGARLKRLRRLSFGDTLALLRPLARALDRAHAAGLIHRDLKPTNLFIAREGDEDVPKILDFGIAKALRSADAAGESTSEGMVLGSPYYMSPEQATGRSDIDHRADLWSLGILVFRALTGKKPWADGPMGAVIVQICSAPIPKATDAAADLPPMVDRFFERALARDPAKRFQSAKELVNAFELLVPARDAVEPMLRDSLADSGPIRILAPESLRPSFGTGLTPPSSPGAAAQPPVETDAAAQPGTTPRTRAIFIGLAIAAALLLLGLAMREGDAPTTTPVVPAPTSTPAAAAPAPAEAATAPTAAADATPSAAAAPSTPPSPPASVSPKIAKTQQPAKSPAKPPTLPKSSPPPEYSRR